MKYRCKIDSPYGRKDHITNYEQPQLYPDVFEPIPENSDAEEHYKWKKFHYSSPAPEEGIYAKIKLREIESIPESQECGSRDWLEYCRSHTQPSDPVLMSPVIRRNEGGFYFLRDLWQETGLKIVIKNCYTLNEDGTKKTWPDLYSELWIQIPKEEK